MSARQKKDLAWTCATQVNGLCTKSTVRGTAEILSFVFQVPFSYGMVQRALNAQALGETRRTRPGPRQKYPLDAEIELVRRVKAMRAQKLATYPSMIMRIADGLIRGTPAEKHFPNGTDYNWYRRFSVILHTISIPTPYLCSIPCRSYVPRLISVVPHYLGYLISYYKPHIMTRCDGRTGPAAEMKSSCKFLVRTCSGSGTGSARAAARARWRRRGCRVD